MSFILLPLSFPKSNLTFLFHPFVHSKVSVDYSQVSCLTAEGVGKGHVLAVTVGGQTSNIYPANISYSTPNVANCEF